MSFAHSTPIGRHISLFSTQFAPAEDAEVSTVVSGELFDFGFRNLKVRRAKIQCVTNQNLQAYYESIESQGQSAPTPSSLGRRTATVCGQFSALMKQEMEDDETLQSVLFNVLGDEIGRKVRAFLSSSTR
jgi:hypothetical protein